MDSTPDGNDGDGGDDGDDADYHDRDHHHHRGGSIPASEAASLAEPAVGVTP